MSILGSFRWFIEISTLESPQRGCFEMSTVKGQHKRGIPETP